MANSQVPVSADPKYQDIMTSLDDDKTGNFILETYADISPTQYKKNITNTIVM